LIAVNVRQIIDGHFYFTDCYLTKLLLLILLIDLHFIIICMKPFITSLLLLSIVYNANAQLSKADKKDSSSNFKFSLSYLSNSVYNGRQDSVVVPYITPMIGYFDKSGFFADASVSYLATTPGRIDLTTIETGYNFTAGDNFSAGIYGSKYFYSAKSTAIQSQISGIIGSAATYDLSFISLNAGVDLAFSQKTDIIVNYGISHPFYIGDDDHLWTIEPSALANTGTQNFYAAAKAKRRGAVTNVKVSSSSGFKVLDYELSLPISYDAQSWGLYFTPTYAIPLNPLLVTKPNGSIFYQETLSNVFYAELSVYFKF